MVDARKGSWFTERLPYFLVAMLLAFLLGYLLRGGGSEAEGRRLQKASEGQVEARSSEKTLYVCPMMCVPPMEKPGLCPVCGMDLIPVSGADMGHDEGRSMLKLSKSAMGLAEIRVAPVERKSPETSIRLFGEIEYDPAHLSYSSAYVPGVIDRVYVKRAGVMVRWGDPLFDINSPEVFYVEQEFLDAMKSVPGFYALEVAKPHVRKRSPIVERKPFEALDRDSPEAKQAMQKIAAIRHKLTLLGLEKTDIDEAMKRGEPTGIVTVYAQRTGTVIEQNAYEGTYVNTGTTIFTIADPRHVWAKLDAYESDYTWIRKGQEVQLQTDAFPGETFRGKVVFIDPVLFDSRKRTFRVGVISPDGEGRLRAGMIVRALIHARLDNAGKVLAEGPGEDQLPLVIPASAPLITGKRAVVYVAVPGKEGVFEGREILLGPRAGDVYVVRDGLEEGERVVVNGNFKIDSGVQILAKASMMSGEWEGEPLQYHQLGGSESMHQLYRAEKTKSRSTSAMERERHDWERLGITPRQGARSSDMRPQRRQLPRLPGSGHTTSAPRSDE